MDWGRARKAKLLVGNQRKALNTHVTTVLRAAVAGSSCYDVSSIGPSAALADLLELALAHGGSGIMA